MWRLELREVWKEKEKKKKKKKKEITQSPVQTKTMNGKLLGRHAKSYDVSPNLQQKPARYLDTIHFFQINSSWIL